MTSRRNPTPPASGPGASQPTDSPTTTCPDARRCTITSLTVSTSRANRARTRIGVAERVTLTVTPAGSYTWAVSGGGSLSTTSGSSVVFTAGARASTSVITATGSGCSCSISFTVVEPNGAYQVQFGATLHTQGQASAGFRGITYLLPKDVTFEYIEINEGNCAGVATGHLISVNGLNHPAWPAWALVGGGTAASGSVVEGPNQTGSTYWDYVWLDAGRGPWAAGTFEWPIPWEFRVNGGTPKAFTTLTHHVVLDGPAGNVTISKGGVSVSAAPSDATETP